MFVTLYRCHSARPRACRGASLLEALIALLIFSIGLLGLLGLQANALGASRDSQYRAEAAVLAHEIIGIMWTDRANLTQYAHNGSGGTACAPSGTATDNVNALRWLNQFTTSGNARFLPGATAAAQQIVVDTDRTVRVTLCWRGPQDAGWHNYTAVARIPA
jgi:type IV pilus assembly protein PilV